VIVAGFDDETGNLGRLPSKDACSGRFPHLRTRGHSYLSLVKITNGEESCSCSGSVTLELGDAEAVQPDKWVRLRQVPRNSILPIDASGPDTVAINRARA